MYSFQQYYKDGTNRSRDCRWYAGLYLVVFLAVYLSYALMQDGFVYHMCAMFFPLFAIVALLVEPYKEEYAIYNSLECVLFLWLSLSCTSVTIIHNAQDL